MTRINKMVMHGFKSFANRTELVFGETFNCVLGPNGSGKSNILDALCFVLGRLGSKSLRATKSANLVYNGGKEKKPMKQGEVSLFFDNEDKTFPTEDPFVKITRIIKKNGQSIYKINDQKRTRQQIIDLMAVARIDPDGHNIILQGDIIRFTEMHPEERRTLIEEISGISVYEDKKQKALKELDKVEERLKEAGIVLAERAAHLKELKRDRDDALKFKDLEVKIKENKASYLHIQIEKKQKRKNELTEKINSKQTEINTLNENIANIKKAIREKKEAIENIDKEIEEKAEKEQIKLQQDIEKLKIQLATNTQRVEHCRNEIEKIDLRKKQLSGNLEELKQEIISLNTRKDEISSERDTKLEELKKVESKINEFKEQNSIQDATEIEKEIDDLDKSVEEKQTEVDTLRKHQQDLVRRKDGIEFQIGTLDEQIDKVKQIEAEHADQISALKNKKEEFKNTISELNQRLEQDSKLAVQISNEKERLSKTQEILAGLEARNAGIKENISGNFAVRKIIEMKKQGVYGTVADLGQVSKDHALALEIAAGPRLNSIVVEDDRIAAECIKYLKSNKSGTATFLPLNKIKARTAEEIKSDGALGMAVDLITFDDKFKKAFSYIFGSTLVVDTLENARKIGIGNIRMVTLDGDLVEVSGAMQGGYRDKKRFAFKEKEVLVDIDKYNAEVSEITALVDNLKDNRQLNEEKIDRLRDLKANLEGEIIKEEKSLHLGSGDVEASNLQKAKLKEEIAVIEKSLEKLEDEISVVIKDITDSKIKKQTLRGKVNAIRNPSLMAELNAFDEKRTKLKENVMELENNIKSVSTEIKDIKEPELERIDQILKGHAKEEEDFNEEIVKLNELIEAVKNNLGSHEQKAQEFYAKNKEMIAKKTRLGDEIQEEDNKIEGLREESKNIEIKMNEISLKNAEVSAKLVGLKEEFTQYEGVALNTTKSEEELKQEIIKFERMVSEIGNVNMRALEIYDGIETEYNSLLAKKESLVNEKVDVIGMMDEIEGRKKELFMKTYDVVNENFQRIFLEISKKGDASLELENEENPFEGGLNIKVRVAGRKFLDIRSLSGGEKTMTALAFIFAIQECEPHSFYILDEVDAALDKHNSEKLAKLVRLYCDRAQYIVISHNDSVISEADTLYGISMNENSTSQVTSLKI